MGNAGTLKYDTKLDGDGFNTGLSKLKASTIAIGSIMAKSLEKVASLAISAGKAIIGIGKSALEAYADFEQLEGGVKKLFGEKDAQTVMENANKAFASAGLSANEYMETVTGFSASLIKSVGGDTAKASKMADMAIQDMADNANTFGTSMETVQNVYQGLARNQYMLLDNLKLGYAGTKAGAEQMIADANAIKKANGEMANLSVENFADMVEAINITQKRLNITGTTAKEASGTISGSVNQMKASWKNLLTGIANDNANFDELVNNFVNSLITMFSNILPRIEIIINGIINLIVGLATNTDLINGLLNAVVNAFNNIVKALKDNTPQLMKAVVTILSTVVKTLLQNVPTLVEVGVQMILELAKGIIEELPTLLEMIPTIIQQIGDVLTEHLPELIEVSLKLILTLIEGLTQHIDKMTKYCPEIIKKIVDTLMEHMDELIPVAVEVIIQLIFGLIQALPQLTTFTPRIIFTIITTLLSHLPEILQAGIKLVWELIKGIAQKITDVGNEAWKIGDKIREKIAEFIGKAFEWGKDLVQNLIKGMQSKKPAVEVATTGVMGAIKKFMHFSRPDAGPMRDYEKWMPDMVEGLATTMEKASPILEKEAENLAYKLRKSMGIQYAIDGIDSGAIDNIRNTVGSEISKMSVAGITGTASEILNTNSRIIVENNNTMLLDGEKVYENQKIVEKNKNLQYAFGN